MYYWLGSDYRASGDTAYTLSYMTQMGGWAVEDYAFNFAEDPILCDWVMLETLAYGAAESGAPEWFPGKENDGSAGGRTTPLGVRLAWEQRNGRGLMVVLGRN